MLDTFYSFSLEKNVSDINLLWCCHSLIACSLIEKLSLDLLFSKINKKNCICLLILLIITGHLVHSVDCDLFVGL